MEAPEKSQSHSVPLYLLNSYGDKSELLKLCRQRLVVIKGEGAENYRLFAMDEFLLHVFGFVLVREKL